MSSSSSERKRPSGKPDKERRATPRNKAEAALQWIKGALARPLRLERRGAQWHLVLAERRRGPRELSAASLSQLRSELRALLLTQEHERAPRLMRHLVLVHDELGRSGWRGVGAMPSAVLAKALVQAEMISGTEPSTMVGQFVERLRTLQVAAGLREERAAKGRATPQDEANVEVSEATHEEFEEMERSWVGVMPPAVPPPKADTDS